MVVRQRGMTAVDMTDDVRVSRENDILVDEAGSGNGGPSGVDCTLNSIFARPSYHLTRRFAVLDRTQTDFAKEPHASRGKIAKVVFDHSVLDHRRPGMNLNSGRAEGRECALRRNCERFEPDDVSRPAGGMNLPRRNHCRDAAVQTGIDPSELVLAWRPISGDRMNVTVDQARRKR